MIAESPRNRSCAAASRLALAIPQLAYERRMSAITRRRGLGCQRGMSMVQLYALHRSLVALVLCSAAIAASATPASARSHHGAARHVHARYAGHHAWRHYAYRHYRHIARASRWNAGVAQMQMRGFADTHASLPSSTASGGMAMSGGFGASNVVAEARRYLGGNPTARA